MTTSEALINVLAQRVAAAYVRLNPGAGPEHRNLIVTASAIAAATLFEAHLNDETIPLDPELYVISQRRSSKPLDPWGDLCGFSAIKVYRNRVRKIVRRLRKELDSELEWAEKQVDDGASVFQVLVKADPKLSAMARFILAHRQGRKTLANRFLHDAVEQHRSCPLYRQAVSDLLPDRLYPDEVYLHRYAVHERLAMLCVEGASQPSWN